MTNINSAHDTLLRVRPMAHGVAVRVARARCPHLDLDDARSAADAALVEAWQCFEPGRGVAFGTYAHAWVRGAVLRISRRASQHASIREALEDDDVIPAGGAPVDVLVAARAALRRVPYRDRGLVFGHVVLERSFAALAVRQSAAALRRRYHRALGAAEAQTWAPG